MGGVADSEKAGGVDKVAGATECCDFIVVGDQRAQNKQISKIVVL